MTLDAFFALAATTSAVVAGPVGEGFGCTPDQAGLCGGRTDVRERGGDEVVEVVGLEANLVRIAWHRRRSDRDQHIGRERGCLPYEREGALPLGVNVEHDQRTQPGADVVNPSRGRCSDLAGRQRGVAAPTLDRRGDPGRQLGDHRLDEPVPRLGQHEVTVRRVVHRCTLARRGGRTVIVPSGATRSAPDWSQYGTVIIRALSVFEGVVYHCYAVDTHHPERPVLEVDARTQVGDLDKGPLLVTVADWATMLGADRARLVLPVLRAKGRIVSWMGVPHVSFPMWTPIHIGNE